jgi:ChrR Cupin-like domain
MYKPSGFAKPELEFVDPTTSDGFTWVPLESDRTGQLSEIILSGSHASGWVTRLLKFEPGCDTTPNGTLTHDVWEEVFIVSGEIHDLRLGQTFTAGMYACRPPGMEHGPWTSGSGAVTFETRFPEPRSFRLLEAT